MVSKKRPSIWKKGYFDVPTWYTEEQVTSIAPKYTRRFGESIEREGFFVVSMLKPVVSGDIEHKVFCQPDTRRYTIFAEVTRQPQVIKYDIPDYAVPEMQKVLTLKE